MITVKTLKVGQLRTNCYLVIDDKTNKCMIIDPGDDADYIIRIISDQELIPTKIVATHGHFDHILAVTELKLAYNIPFLMHEKDMFLLKRMRSSAKYFTGVLADPPPKVDKFLSKGDKVRLGKTYLEVLETGGHTPGGISLYSANNSTIFVGDLVFSRGAIGRCDFAYSNNVVLRKSVEKTMSLPESTVIYPGHGDKTSISQLNKYFV